LITKKLDFVEGTFTFALPDKEVDIIYEALILSKGNYDLKYYLEDMNDDGLWGEVYPEYDSEINELIKKDVDWYLENEPVSVVKVSKADVEGSGYSPITSNQLDEIANRLESGCMYNYWETLKIACEDLGLEKK
jgi:hypothetical protein